MGLFKTQDEKQQLYFFRIRKETGGYRVCIDHHFAITSYIEKIVFPGEKRQLLWENWLLKGVDLALLACLGFHAEEHQE